MREDRVRSNRLGRVWSRRAELFGDISSGPAVCHAMVDGIQRPGEGNEWMSTALSEAAVGLLYDASSPGGIRSPATVSDEELSRAGVPREQLEYWVAMERIALIDVGGRVDEVLPLLSSVPRSRPLLAVRERRGARVRPGRRRARRCARAPDDPSRPRPKQRSAVAAGWSA